MEDTRSDTTRHAYATDLAYFVHDRGGQVGLGLPRDPEALETLISTCYQASLLHEEERPVTFRAILCDPAELPARGGPPDGLHLLEFPEPRPLGVQELRRLAPAADYYRSLVGVGWDEENGLRIWGLVHSGPRWLRANQGGRAVPLVLPPALILRVSGPGRIAVDAGSKALGKLEEGILSDVSLDVFASRWLADAYAPVRGEIAEIHAEAREQARKEGEIWARLDTAEMTRVIGQHTLKRVISAVRDSHHGGTVVIVPPDLADDVIEGRYVSLKYRFANAEPRRRFRTLIVGAMNTLARSHGGTPAGDPVGWDDYEASSDEDLSALDEAMFEVAYLVAGLAAVDGACVMTQRLELLGFGGEISGELPPVRTVARALDIEAHATVEESTEGVGTRHRSAYRLCNALPDVIAVVVSQDGNVRFVKSKDGVVTYWDHQA